MTTNRHRVAVACVLVLAAGLLYAQGLRAQVPTVEVKAKAVEPIEFTKVVLANTADTVFTVAPGKRLVITDILVRNPDSDDAGIGLARTDDTLFLSMVVPPNGMFPHSFATGIQFSAGQPVKLFNGHDELTLWYLTGYLANS